MKYNLIEILTAISASSGRVHFKMFPRWFALHLHRSRSLDGCGLEVKQTCVLLGERGLKNATQRSLFRKKNKIDKTCV